MSLINDEELESLTIHRMIFHVVGRSLEVPKLLNEINPPLYTDFFIERIKSSLKGNLFNFTNRSNTERILRIIDSDADHLTDCFSEQSKLLASDFQSRHNRNTSDGVFFLFELRSHDKKYFAIIKYDNEDVVRYKLDEDQDEAQVPILERFHETFVRKAEAMQKIALVKLSDRFGGVVAVIDRSKRTHISDYFEGFLQVKRVNSESDLNEKLVKVLKAVLKENKTLLPVDVAREGVSRIYSTLRRGEFDFDTNEPLTHLVSIFGPLSVDSKIVKDFNKESKKIGILGESFIVKAEYLQVPAKRRIETAENVTILFDENTIPSRRVLPDGKIELKIITSRIVIDDIDNESTRRSD